MRVLHVTEACRSGVQRHLALVLPPLTARGMECRLLPLGGRRSADFEEELGAYLLPSEPPLSGSRFQVLRRSVSLIRHHVETWQPDVVVLHSFIAGVAGRIALRRTRWAEQRIAYVPHAFSFHRPQPWYIRWLIDQVERSLISRVGACICVGEGDVMDARRLGIPETKLFCCHNGLPASLPFADRLEARRFLGLPEQGIIGVMPARLEPQKGMMQLLQALVLVHRRDFSIKCYGDGSLRSSALRFIEAHGLSDVISIQEEQPRLWMYARAFDFLVQPSWYEGSSYSMLEAAAAGVPILTTRIPGAPDGARTCPLSDVTALAELLEELDLRQQDVTLPSLEHQIDELAHVFEFLNPSCRHS